MCRLIDYVLDVIGHIGDLIQPALHANIIFVFWVCVSQAASDLDQLKPTQVFYFFIYDISKACSPEMPQRPQQFLFVALSL